MKPINKDKLCYWCIGCNREEKEEFDGVRNCKHFIAGLSNWQEIYRKELKKNGKV